MTASDHILPPPPSWAPWVTDLATLHIARDVPEDHAIYGLGACAAYGFIDPAKLHGPRLRVDLARPISAYSDGYVACRACTEIAIAEAALQAEERLREYLAYEIRADLVCCDAYDVCRPSALDDNVPLSEHPAYHDLCYWGEAVAREIEEPGYEDCEHRGGSWFDRTLCASPCDTMHDRCVDCGGPLGSCRNRYARYYEAVPAWVEQAYQTRLAAAPDSLLAWRIMAPPNPVVLAEIKRRLADGTMPRRTVSLRDISELSEDD